MELKIWGDSGHHLAITNLWVPRTAVDLAPSAFGKTNWFRSGLSNRTGLPGSGRGPAPPG